MKKILGCIFMLAALALPVRAVSTSVTLINSSGLAFSTAPAQNLLNFTAGVASTTASAGIASKLSAQVTYSSATIPNQTFNGGEVSTGSITVVSTAALVATNAIDTLIMPTTAQILGSPATGYITVVSTTGLGGFVSSATVTLANNFAGIAIASPSITVDGYNTFTYAGNWASSNSVSGSAVNLAAAINASGNYTAYIVNSTNVVINTISSSTFQNGLIVTSSSATLVSSGTFKGGANPVTVTINNTVQNFVFTYQGNWASTDTVNHAATELATLIDQIGDANNTSLIPTGLLAAAGGNVVASTAEVNGTLANSFTMATSSPALVSTSAFNFSGGLNPILRNAFFSIGGTVYKNGYGWTDASGTSTGTAGSIAAFLNTVTTNSVVVAGGFGNVSALAVGSTVTMTAGLPGSAGNSLSLVASSSSGFTVGSALFTGGQDNASFNIGGVTFQYPTNWTLGTSSTTTSTAGSIGAAINSNSLTHAVLVATNTANVVNATGTVTGLNTNYSLTSSTVALATMGFTGGLNTAYSSGSATIAISSHNFTQALPVLFTTGGVVVTGLTNQTTYFVIVVDANDIQLAATSTGAAAGLGIVISTKDVSTSVHNATLAPLAFVQGQASAKWEVSNDGLNWAPYSTTALGIAVSSDTFTPVNPSTTTARDFGFMDYNYIRYNITGPTQGGVVLKVILTSKD